MSVAVSVENGNYMLSVTGAIGESTEISLSVIDNNMSNEVTSKSSKQLASPATSTTSNSAVAVGSAFGSTTGIIVNIVNSATGGGSGSGGGGGGCFGGFTHGQSGNLNQFFNLFIFFIPLLYLAVRRYRMFFSFTKNIR